MIDWTKRTLVLRGSCGWTMALLTWEELVGLNGGFSGRAVASGAVARWELESPSGGTLEGAYHGPWEQVIAGREVGVDWQTVERWVEKAKAVEKPAPEMPSADFDVWVGDRRFVVSPLRHVLASLSLNHGVGQTPPIDLSPLANLATAVAWGLALESVVTEWRNWHPAARVSWDINAGLNKGDEAALRVSYAIEGIGHVQDVITDLGGRAQVEWLADDIEDAKIAAARAMAPHYVAPAPKAENRDAALRRFADGVTR